MFEFLDYDPKFPWGKEALRTFMKMQDFNYGESKSTNDRVRDSPKIVVMRSDYLDYLESFIEIMIKSFFGKMRVGFLRICQDQKDGFFCQRLSCVSRLLRTKWKWK